MSLRTLKLFTIFIPTLMIGGFEYIRHGFLLDYLSMEAGNHYITVLTFLLSYVFATWMFKKIHYINQHLAEERARLAVYEERERLARDLHDNISQITFFLNVSLKQGKIDEARSAVSEIDNHLRQAIFHLRTLPKNGNRLCERLVKWIQEWSALTGIEVHHQISVKQGRFTTGEEILLFGIIQEAFTNIRKHSHATFASVRLFETDNGWSMHMMDNGTGMAIPSEPKQTYGLSMMRKRAEELGADFTIQPAAEGGTEILLDYIHSRRKS